MRLCALFITTWSNIILLFTETYKIRKMERKTKFTRSIQTQNIHTSVFYIFVTYFHFIIFIYFMLINLYLCMKGDISWATAVEYNI